MVISGTTSAESLDILQPERLSAEMISQGSILNITWYAGVLARIRINAFRIELAGGSYEDLLASAIASVESEAAVGNAVYMLPSFYNHDCDPNTHIIWLQNVEARLKALREIEAGEELRICYIDASMDRDARRNLLSNGFGFECRCPRCMSND
nr:histone-lysine N-methyltransferase ATXR4 [Tanacetum cinerariifolium]